MRDDADPPKGGRIIRQSRAMKWASHIFLALLILVPIVIFIWMWVVVHAGPRT